MNQSIISLLSLAICQKNRFSDAFCKKTQTFKRTVCLYTQLPTEPLPVNNTLLFTSLLIPELNQVTWNPQILQPLLSLEKVVLNNPPFPGHLATYLKYYSPFQILHL